MRSDPNFHDLLTLVDTTSLRLNNPYDYRPHMLVVEASREFRSQLEQAANDDFTMLEELQRGKMLGVLVVRSLDGEVGYLGAFSGAMAGRTVVEGCVPPIYTLDGDDGYYRAQERRVVELSREIELLEMSEERRRALQSCEEAIRQAEQSIRSAREEYGESKIRRAEQRIGADGDMLSRINRESQHQKGELRRLESRLRAQIAREQLTISNFNNDLEQLRAHRSNLSSGLQRWMYEQYKVLNGVGEWRSLYSIFEESLHRLPPSGAGECAAPKLLHYAFANGYTPLAIGEFWVGDSPRGEVRRDGQFYGACRGKCYPILGFMLRGVELEPIDEQLQRERRVESELKLIFEDEAIMVFNKPAGLLSVEGLIDAPSVESLVLQCDPSAKVVHRLDQDTSGLILVAKGFENYRLLQRQFMERTLQKRYVALVEGSVTPKRGEISLPIRLNPLDRPRQMVDHTHKKPSHTMYKVLGMTHEGYSRLALYPHTGRTHQLRVHCAHVEGLGAPIVGDRLYGRGVEICDRLCLHAESITFTHPTTGERMTFTQPSTF
ncbi:MAG: pseudouridine synthase [Rikenellaceae bacterium]